MDSFSEQLTHEFQSLPISGDAIVPESRKDRGVRALTVIKFERIGGVIAVLSRKGLVPWRNDLLQDSYI